MSQSTSPKAILVPIARGIGFLLITVTGLFTAFVCQASSPDYRELFWTVAPVAVIHFIAVGIYFRLVSDGDRWVAVAIGGFAAASFGEMALRVL